MLCGPHGSGQTVKAANQLIVAGTIELVAEAIVFLEAYGVDTEAAVKVLAGGLAGNAILERKAEGMLRRDFTPGFRIELHHKDMGIVLAAAREAGVIIPLGAVVAQLIASLKAQGDGGLDDFLGPMFAVEDQAHLDPHPVDALGLHADEGAVVAAASRDQPGRHREHDAIVDFRLGQIRMALGRARQFWNIAGIVAEITVARGVVSA